MPTAETLVAIRGLREAIATPPGRDDLGRLAQMHTWCQTLAAATPDAAPGAAAELAAALVRLLEALILDELDDASAGAALLAPAILALESAIDGDGSAAPDLVTQIEGSLAGGPGRVLVPAEQVFSEPDEEDAGESDDAPAAGKPTAPPMAARTDVMAAFEPYVSEPLVLDLAERDTLCAFVDEAREHFDAIERALLAVEQRPDDPAQINELFRPFHTIKGGAGFLNLRDINHLAHEVETLLDMARKGERPLTPALIDLVFAATDVLRAQTESLHRFLVGPADGPCPQPDCTGVIDRLRRAALGDARPAEATGGPSATGHGDDAPQAARPTGRESSIRVDTPKLDALVDAVGELVIAQSMVSLDAHVAGDERLQRCVARVTKIIRAVQDTALALRMIPIGPTFQRMRRVARDVAHKTGRQVELSIAGEETDLDRNVIEQIADPLVHMVRNAIDHGIEPPDERRRLGKTEIGRVHLAARHEGGSVLISVADDGRGLERARILATARARGLVDPAAPLTDEQVFALVFHPGFSTAERITEISGRGVGMDVVLRNVEQLRGKIEIASAPRQGSTFTIRLPLTLAIVDGMVVRVGAARLIIPTLIIERAFRPAPDEIRTVQQRGELIRMHGELVPLAQPSVLLGYGPRIDPCGALVVVVRCDHQKLGLVVDELVGPQQVVVKTLGPRFARVQGVSGAAILGDGRVGLILEPSGVLALHARSAAPRGPTRVVQEAAVTAG